MSTAKANTLHCRARPLAKTDPRQRMFMAKGVHKTQWLGGDNATSMPLDHHHYLWTFGDTFWGTFPKQTPSFRTSYYFTHDSLGIMNIKKKRMEFFNHGNSANSPISFLSADEPGHYYWILSGTRIKNQIVLGLVEIAQKDKQFEIVNTAYAILDNQHAPVPAWHFKIFSLAKVLPDNELLETTQWGSALVPYLDMLYLFGAAKNPLKQPHMRLARISHQAILKGDWRQLSFWVNDKGTTRFKSLPVLSAELATVQGLPSMSEFSFYYDKETKKWYALYIPLLGKKVSLYSAKKLTGPWENKGVIYSIPSPWSTTHFEGKDLFISYAPKFHPELILRKMPQTLSFIFSYMNNLNEFELPGISEAKSKMMLKRYPLFYLPILVAVQCEVKDI